MRPEDIIPDLEKIMKLKFSGSSRPASMVEAIRILKFCVVRKPKFDGEYLCPNCGCEVTINHYCGVSEYHCSFCPECGQAIDWSDGNE